jgi:YD repeat-containing protein
MIQEMPSLEDTKSTYKEATKTDDRALEYTIGADPGSYRSAVAAMITGKGTSGILPEFDPIEKKLLLYMQSQETENDTVEHLPGDRRRYKTLDGSINTSDDAYQKIVEEKQGKTTTSYYEGNSYSQAASETTDKDGVVHLTFARGPHDSKQLTAKMTINPRSGEIVRTATDGQTTKLYWNGSGYTEGTAKKLADGKVEITFDDKLRGIDKKAIYDQKAGSYEIERHWPWSDDTEGPKKETIKYAWNAEHKKLMRK